MTRGVDLVFPKRGRRTIESLLVYSGYPIGLFRKGRLQPLGEERIVFPRPAKARPPRPDPRDTDQGDPRSRLRGRFGDKPTVRREALFYAAIAAAAGPQKTTESLTTLADAFAWNGRFSDAVIAIREAMELTPDQPPDVRRKLESQLRALEAK